jgi:hypothetical protein
VQDSYGVAALVRAAVWFNATVKLEVLGIGRSACGKEDCAMELAGTQLLIRISLQGGWIWVAAGSLDEGEPPQPLFNVGDTAEGWTAVRRFIRALENSGVKSLRERPIRIGAEGPDSYVIS